MATSPKASQTSTSTSPTSTSTTLPPPSAQTQQCSPHTITDTSNYFADKDLSWWLQLARTFKTAVKVPLPEDSDAEL